MSKKAKKKVVKKVEHGFVFIGNGKDDPASIKLDDYLFLLNGKPVEVADTVLASRLRNNSHFTEV